MTNKELLIFVEKCLDHPVSGLRDSSNTNKFRTRILGAIEQTLKEREEEILAEIGQ